ncbi:MAG: tetratricopeptide repeat protein, partial [Gemmatimonadota bacterium]
DYPDCDTELRAAAYYSAGWSSERLNDPDRSLELYSQVAANFPRSPQAPLCLLRIGRINTEQQHFEDAIAAYRTIASEYGDTRHAADANYGLGMLYKAQGKPDEAVAAFRQVGRDAGQVYVVSLVEAAKIHIEQDRADEGRKLLTELLAGVTGDRDLEATAHYQMGQLEFGIKNYTDAIRQYTTVIDEYPGTEVIQDSHYGRGLAYHYAGRYSRAVEDYRWLLDSDLPDAMVMKVWFSLALSLAAEGQDAEATKILNEVISAGDETLARNAQLQLISMAEKQDPRDAIRTYESMLSRLEAGEDRVRVLIRLASAYFRLGEFEQSIAASQQLLDIAVDENDVANALFVQGNSYFRSRNYDKAIATYQTIIDNYPQIGWAKNARFQIGAAYNTLSGGGNVQYLPLMSKAFERYYTDYPDDEAAVVAYYYDAWARYRMGKWRDASNTFEQLARRFPQSKYAPEALFRSGESVYNLAQSGTLEEKTAVYQEAMAKYDVVIRQYGSSDYGDDALYNKAWALISLGRKAEALPIFERIVTQFPDGRYGAQSQFTLGDYYYGEKDYAQAAASYQRFLELYPESRLASQDRGLRRKATILLGHLAEIDAYNLYSEGEKLFDQKSYTEAIRIFQEVRQKYPDSDQSVNAAVNMGAAYMAMEDYRQAGEQFKSIVDNYATVPRFAPQVDFANQQLKALEEARVL